MSCHALNILGLILGGGLVFGQNANSPYVLRTFARSFPLGDGGPATQALLSAPHAVVTDNSGNVFVLDPGNYRIRKFTPGGAISTVVQLGVYVNDMKLGKDGNFYLTASGLVYKLSPAGTVTVLAGNGAVNLLVGRRGLLVLNVDLVNHLLHVRDTRGGSFRSGARRLRIYLAA